MSDVLWADLTKSLMDRLNLLQEKMEIRRLFSPNHWQVPVKFGGNVELILLVFAETLLVLTCLKIATTAETMMIPGSGSFILTGASTLR